MEPNPISKNVVAFARGNGKSTHYEYPVNIDFYNKTNSEEIIIIPAGSILKAEDSLVQDFLVTEPIYFVMHAFEKKNVEVKGLCMKMNNRAPNEKDKFQLIANNQNTMLNDYPKFIKENKVSSLTSQYALWTLLNQTKPEDLEAETMAETNKLRSFYLKYHPKSNLKLLTEQSFAATKNRVIEYSTTINGQIDFYTSKAAFLHISIFNAENIVIKEVYKEQILVGGDKVIKYQIKLKPEEENQKIYAKAIVDGRIFHSWTIIE